MNAKTDSDYRIMLQQLGFSALSGNNGHTLSMLSVGQLWSDINASKNWC